MRLTIRTNLAARVLMYCAVNMGRTVRSADIAEACNASGNHMAQVIHQLQLNGFVATQRGRSGGLQLAMPPERISIGQGFRTFEAGGPLTPCLAPPAKSPRRRTPAPSTPTAACAATSPARWNPSTASWTM